ncbi:hypothetical protein JCM5350_002588 [Sporobolomyces pararoseus]
MPSAKRPRELEVIEDPFWDVGAFIKLKSQVEHVFSATTRSSSARTDRDLVRRTFIALAVSTEYAKAKPDRQNDKVLMQPYLKVLVIDVGQTRRSETLEELCEFVEDLSEQLDWEIEVTTESYDGNAESQQSQTAELTQGSRVRISFPSQSRYEQSFLLKSALEYVFNNYLGRLDETPSAQLIEDLEDASNSLTKAFDLFKKWRSWHKDKNPKKSLTAHGAAKWFKRKYDHDLHYLLSDPSATIDLTDTPPAPTLPPTSFKAVDSPVSPSRAPKRQKVVDSSTTSSSTSPSTQLPAKMKLSSPDGVGFSLPPKRSRANGKLSKDKQAESDANGSVGNHAKGKRRANASGNDIEDREEATSENEREDAEPRVDPEGGNSLPRKEARAQFLFNETFSRHGPSAFLEEGSPPAQTPHLLKRNGLPVYLTEDEASCGPMYPTRLSTGELVLSTVASPNDSEEDKLINSTAFIHQAPTFDLGGIGRDAMEDLFTNGTRIHMIAYRAGSDFLRFLSLPLVAEWAARPGSQCHFSGSSACVSEMRSELSRLNDLYRSSRPDKSDTFTVTIVKSPGIASVHSKLAFATLATGLGIKVWISSCNLGRAGLALGTKDSVPENVSVESGIMLTLPHGSLLLEKILPTYDAYHSHGLDNGYFFDNSEDSFKDPHANPLFTGAIKKLEKQAMKAKHAKKVDTRHLLSSHIGLKIAEGQFALTPSKNHNLAKTRFQQLVGTSKHRSSDLKMNCLTKPSVGYQASFKAGVAEDDLEVLRISAACKELVVTDVAKDGLTIDLHGILPSFYNEVLKTQNELKGWNAITTSLRNFLSKVSVDHPHVELFRTLLNGQDHARISSYLSIALGPEVYFPASRQGQPKITLRGMAAVADHQRWYPFCHPGSQRKKAPLPPWKNDPSSSTPANPSPSTSTSSSTTMKMEEEPQEHPAAEEEEEPWQEDSCDSDDGNADNDDMATATDSDEQLEDLVDLYAAYLEGLAGQD